MGASLADRAPAQQAQAAGAQPSAGPSAPAALQLPPPLAPPKDEPAWLVYERAMERKAKGELGEALDLLQRVRPSGFKAPEVEMAMGDIFRAQAEPDLAAWHYSKAYELKSSFETADDRFAVLYRMADMHRQLGQYSRMEEALQAALGEAERVSPFGRLHDAVARVYRQIGIDRVLELYRLPELPTARAHSGLAWYYGRSGKPADAVEHALFGIIIELSQAIEEYRLRLPHYRYESVSRFLSLAAKEPDILQFLEASTLPADIYNLGVALQALGDGEAAGRAWHLLSGSPLEGRWRDLADRQLARPFPERLPAAAPAAARRAPAP